jgi:hypothetical protein
VRFGGSVEQEVDGDKQQRDQRPREDREREREVHPSEEAIRHPTASQSIAVAGDGGEGGGRHRSAQSLTRRDSRRLNTAYGRCYVGSVEGGPTSDSESRSGRRSAVLVAVALLALLALVTLAASGGSAFSGDAADREPSTGAYDYLFTFGLVFAAAAMALTLYLVRPSARFRHARGAGHGLGWSLVALAIALVFALGVLLASRGNDNERAPGAAAPSGQGAARQEERQPEPARARSPEFEWTAALAFGGAVLAGAACAVVVARRRRRRGAGLQGQEQLVAELGALLDATLDDLRAEPDPRRAVIAAYARLERAFAVYGVPRRPFEAPHEYLHRLSRALEAALPAVVLLASELTHLYERAKFSAQEIDSRMKTDAISALEALRDKLSSSSAPVEEAA